MIISLGVLFLLTEDFDTEKDVQDFRDDCNSYSKYPQSPSSKF